MGGILAQEEGGVRKRLQECNPNKASGPDCILARILRECADKIASILTAIFTGSINDLCDKIHVVSRTSLFADDCIVYRTIKDTADCKALQQDLAALESGERKLVMEFHPQKCIV